jgi:hypothetical protein
MARLLIRDRNPLPFDAAFAHMTDLTFFSHRDPAARRAEHTPGSGSGSGAEPDIEIGNVDSDELVWHDRQRQPIHELPDLPSGRRNETPVRPQDLWDWVSKRCLLRPR